MSVVIIDFFVSRIRRCIGTSSEKLHRHLNKNTSMHDRQNLSLMRYILQSIIYSKVLMS